MLHIKKYKVDTSDHFQPSDFPKVIHELNALSKVLSDSPPAYKKEILISFLKKQSLHDDWITSNPELTSLISSGIFATGHLESLFESCHQNKQFRQQYEDYISKIIIQKKTVA